MTFSANTKASQRRIVQHEGRLYPTEFDPYPKTAENAALRALRIRNLIWDQIADMSPRKRVEVMTEAVRRVLKGSAMSNILPFLCGFGCGACLALCLGIRFLSRCLDSRNRALRNELMLRNEILRANRTNNRWHLLHRN